MKTLREHHFLRHMTTSPPLELDPRARRCGCGTLLYPDELCTCSRRDPESRPFACATASKHVCYGSLRKCPVCKRLVCWADGGADVFERLAPGICDDCSATVSFDPVQSVAPL